MTTGLARLKGDWERWALAALLVVHVVLGVYWSVTIPILEAHDEDGHYFFVRYLATQHRLPPPAEDSPSNNDEYHQPPLYYILAALPVAFVDLEEEFIPRYNPYIGLPEAQGGRNKVVHDPALESWPYRGDILAIHLARWVSVLLGALALVFTFLAARTLCPEEPWVRWGAVLVHAFWPQFRFTTAVINNDLMMTVSAALVTWLLVRVAVAPQVRLGDMLALGGATGLALLSKGNGLGLVPVVLVVLLAKGLTARRAVRSRAMAGLGGSLALGGIAVGWWYWHNLSSGAEVFGGDRDVAHVVWRLAQIFGEKAFEWDLIRPALRHGLATWWAGFGWNNLSLPEAVYLAAAAWLGLGVAGLAVLAVRLARRPQRGLVGGLLALALVAGVMAGGLILLGLGRGSGTAIHGRIMLSAVPAVSVLLGVAWVALLPRGVRPAAWALMAGALAALAVVSPGLYIRSAYAQPPQLAEAKLADYAPAHVTFGDFVELVAYKIDNGKVGPGDRLRAILVWRVLAQTPEDYALRLKVFDHDGTLGEVWRYPGQGALGTTTWRPGHLFLEEAAIPINSENGDARQAWLEVKYDGPAELEVRDGEGRSINDALRIGGIKVRGGAVARLIAHEDSLQFGPAIRLIGGRAALSHEADAGWQLGLAVQWAAVQAPGCDYTVSLQLRDAGDGMVIQVDEQPRQGTYPTTLWEPGEVVEDPYVLMLPADLPDGEHDLHICVYDAETLQRLPVVGPEGSSESLDEAALVRLTVEDGRPGLEELHPFVSVE